MTLRKFSIIRTYNFLVIIVSISCVIAMMTFLIDKYVGINLQNKTYENAFDPAQGNQKYTAKTNVIGENKTNVVLENCIPKTKIGFLKIHKAASR